MRIYLLLLFTLLTLSACVEMQGFKPISEMFSNKQPAQPAIKVKNSTALSLVQSKAKLSDTLPLLQIDPGGHKALIWKVVFTRDGRYLVSAGADKLIRVWDLETGRTVRTLRGQIGAGFEGTIYAMALSPDGQWLAAGGWTHPQCAGRCGDIRLYNFITGKIVTLLKGHTNSVFSLEFSPDSRYLVSGSYDKNAILWDVKQQRRLHTLQGHTDAIYAVGFTHDSKRVVTGSDDHSLRLWQVDNGKLLSILKGHAGKVRTLAISPQDGSIASGSWDYSIRLWDGQSGRFIKTLAHQGTRVRGLSFSPDGRYLLSGVAMLIGPFYCHVYSVSTGKELLTYKAHGNIVIATAISPDGRWAVTSGGNDQAIHIWNLRSGQLKQRLVGVGASTWAVGFSKDGKNLGWGKTQRRINPTNRGPLEYSLSFPTPTRPLGVPKAIKQDKNYLRGQDQWRNWSLHTRKGGKYGHQAILEIRQQNRIQASIERGSTNGYGHRAYTFSPNGETIISGGANGVLTAYNRAGQKLGNYIGHTSDIWAVAASPDGRLLASASADQTVRLWNLNSHENLLTIFQGSNGEWVAWTPSGHYTASPNGDAMVGWQINRGSNKAADYVSADQVRHHFYRPDITDNTIKLLDHKQALAQADSTEFSLGTLNTALPPEFSIIDPLNHSTTRNGELKIVLNFKHSQEPLENLVAYVNGSLVDNVKKWALGGGSKQQKNLTLPLQRGNNKIRIVAKNRIGFTTKELDINFKSRDQFSKPGTLYLVAVGVSEYQNPANSLQFAATDAHSIHDYFTGPAGKKLYKRVETRLLADGATRPTAANIKAALNLFKQAKPEDTVILFLSGHGANEGADYYFLPYDTDANNLNSLIKWDILQKALEESKGRRLLLVDTCHAGGAYNSRLVKDTSDSNIVVISATDSQSVAQELPNLGHGVFTYALLQGLGGKANMFGDDKDISIKELDTYLGFVVKKLTNGIQVPVLHAPGGFKDFVFAKL